MSAEEFITLGINALDMYPNTTLRTVGGVRLQPIKLPNLSNIKLKALGFYFWRISGYGPVNTIGLYEGGKTPDDPTGAKIIAQKYYLKSRPNGWNRIPFDDVPLDKDKHYFLAIKSYRCKLIVGQSNQLEMKAGNIYLGPQLTPPEFTDTYSNAYGPFEDVIPERKLLPYTYEIAMFLDYTADPPIEAEEPLTLEILDEKINSIDGRITVLES